MQSPSASEKTRGCAFCILSARKLFQTAQCSVAECSVLSCAVINADPASNDNGLAIYDPVKGRSAGLSTVEGLTRSWGA